MIAGQEPPSAVLDGAPWRIVDGIETSDVAADVADVAAFLAADTTDVLAADTTDVLSAAKAADGACWPANNPCASGVAQFLCFSGKMYVLEKHDMPPCHFGSIWG